MRAIMSLLAISCLSVAAEQLVSKVAFSESKHAIHAFSRAGDITILTNYPGDATSFLSGLESGLVVVGQAVEKGFACTSVGRHGGNWRSVIQNRWD